MESVGLPLRLPCLRPVRLTRRSAILAVMSNVRLYSKQHCPYCVRAKALLDKNIGQVKTGLPGIASVRTDPRLDWPANLAVKLPP